MAHARDPQRGNALPVVLALVLGFVLLGGLVWAYRKDFHARFEEPLIRLGAPQDSLAQLRSRGSRDSLLADSLRRVIGGQVSQRLVARAAEKARLDSLGRGEALRLDSSATRATVRVPPPLDDRELDLLGTGLRHLPPEGAARMLQRLGPREGARVLARLSPVGRQAVLDSLPVVLADTLRAGLSGPGRSRTQG